MEIDAYAVGEVDRDKYSGKTDKEQVESSYSGRMYSNSKILPSIVFAHGIKDIFVEGLGRRVVFLEKEKYLSFTDLLSLANCSEASQSLEGSANASTDSDGTTTSSAGAEYNISSSSNDGTTYSASAEGQISHDSNGNTSASISVSGKIEW